jgi:hypothetical protein
MITKSVVKVRLFLSAATIWLASLLLVPQAQAIAFSSCGGEPFAFENAEVNVVILPYFQSGASPRQLDGLGSQLALLIKLETLYRAMTYDQWGIVLLTGPKKDCDPEKIANELLLTKHIHPGGRLIMVWGNLYQQDEDVYVQTFAKFYRNPLSGETTTPPEIGIQLAGKTFQGRVNGQEFAFPPEQLPIFVMNAVADNFKKAVYLYDAPQLSSSKTPIPLNQFRKCDDCRGALAFTVEGRDGDWVHVKAQGGRDGYLVARLEEGVSLNQRMPEVSFLQGLMGFLRYSVQGQDADRSRWSAGMKVAEQALMEYAQRDEAAQEPETKAAALQLSGMLEFAHTGKDPSEQFDTAYQLAPYSSDSRNLAAVFRLYRNYNSPARNLRPRDLANDFVAAVALDPKNALVLANLQSLYELLASPETEAKINPDFAIKPSELQASIEKVKAIRHKVTEESTPVQ